MNINGQSMSSFDRKHYPACDPEWTSITGRIQMGMLTKCLEKSYDLMIINGLSIGKMALEIFHYLNFNTNLSANIW